MSDSSPVTLEMLEAAIAKVKESRSDPCEHVVHPKAEGWTRCANCGQPLNVETVDGRKRLR